MSTTSENPAGYSIEEGNAASRNAYNWSKKTFQNRAGKPGEPAQDLDGGFSNEIRFGAERLGISSDGIGTKIEVAERLNQYDTLGYDLIAMTADDLIAAGFVPTNLSNIIDVNHLDYDVVDQMMRGLHDAANFAQVAITGGEIAELGNRIGGWPGAKMNFNWCSTAIGVLHPSLAQPLSGKTAQAGHAVVALRSPSFRSNGYSLARKTLQKVFGDNWHEAALRRPRRRPVRQLGRGHARALAHLLARRGGPARRRPAAARRGPHHRRRRGRQLPARAQKRPRRGAGQPVCAPARHAAPLRNRRHQRRNRLPLLEHGHRHARS